MWNLYSFGNKQISINGLIDGHLTRSLNIIDMLDIRTIYKALEHLSQVIICECVNAVYFQYLHLPDDFI